MVNKGDHYYVHMHVRSQRCQPAGRCICQRKTPTRLDSSANCGACAQWSSTLRHLQNTAGRFTLRTHYVYVIDVWYGYTVYRIPDITFGVIQTIVENVCG